jgi:hypothetical protein
MAENQTPGNATPDADGTPARGGKREGPAPAHILLNALQCALEAGVDRATLANIVAMADEAEGVLQAPVWKMLAGMLAKATAKATDAQPAAK